MAFTMDIKSFLCFFLQLPHTPSHPLPPVLLVPLRSLPLWTASTHPSKPLSVQAFLPGDLFFQGLSKTSSGLPFSQMPLSLAQTGSLSFSSVELQTLGKHCNCHPATSPRRLPDEWGTQSSPFLRCPEGTRSLTHSFIHFANLHGRLHRQAAGTVLSVRNTQ